MKDLPTIKILVGIKLRIILHSRIWMNKDISNLMIGQSMEVREAITISVIFKIKTLTLNMIIKRFILLNKTKTYTIK